jgi:hypothetical protein
MRRSFLSTLTTVLSTVIFSSFAALPAWAVSPDLKLLSLVPPHAEILSGIKPSPSKEQSNRFLLATKQDKIDMDDLAALIGVDSNRGTYEILLEAARDHSGRLNEHSLLVSGRFDQARIFRSAVSNGATVTKYRGVDVLVVVPFLRERGVLDDVRWLAILDSGIVLFGTISSVEEELDRYLSHSSAEPFFRRSLGRLKRNNETWSMLLASSGNAQTPIAIKSIGPALPGVIPMGSTLAFSTHYGSQIEFEYDLSASSEADIQASSHSLSLTFLGSTAKTSSFLSESKSSRPEYDLHGEGKLTKEQYEAWMAEIAAKNAVRDASAHP